MLIISDRVKESSLTTGSGAVVFDSPFGSFQSFQAGIGNGNTTYYCIENGVRWEVGQGVYTQSGNSLSRDVVFDSSASGAKINLEGVSTVFCTLPADKAIIKNEASGTYVVNVSTLELNASGINSNSLANSGDAVFGNDVLVSGDLTVVGSLFGIDDISTSGDIVSSGFLTLIRPNGDAGNFFHAYKEDGTQQTAALHMDGNISPMWKLGLKTNPTSQTAPPTFAYVFAKDGSAGMVSNTDNYASVSDGIGFTVYHDTNTVFRASSLTGVYIETTSSVNPSLVITGPPVPTTDLQRWSQYDDTILSVVDSGGKLGILNDTPVYEIDVNGSGRMDTIYLTSGIFFQDGTFQNTAGGGGGNLQEVTDSGSFTTNAITINNDLFAVSGHMSGIDLTPLSDAVHPPHLEGRLFYDSDNHALTIYNEEADVALQLGQEEYLRVRNDKAYVIPNGSGVYIDGSQGTHPTIDFAIASGENTSHVAGLATHDIESNSFGYVSTYGIVRSLDTSAFSDGDEVYLSATASGTYTTTPPVAPNYEAAIGHVIRSHASNGTILSRSRQPKLGGNDVKNLGNISNSGIAFFSQVTDENAGILSTDSNFYYDSGNAQLILGSGGIQIAGSILDSNGNELVDFVEDASAVNHVEIENEATGSGPIIRTAGDDVDIDLNLAAKGTGSLFLNTWEVDGNTLRGPAPPVITGLGNMLISSWGTILQRSGVDHLQVRNGQVAIARDIEFGFTDGVALSTGTVDTKMSRSSAGFFAMDPVIITANNITDVPLSIKAAAAQSADYLQLTSNGGTAGDVMKIDSTGAARFNSNISANTYLSISTTTQFTNSSGAGVFVSSGGVNLGTSFSASIITGSFNGDTTIGPARNDSNEFGDVVINGGGNENHRFVANGTQTSSATLDNATGNEIANTLAYTTNKLTSGDDTGLLISKTDMASPGTSLLLDIQTDAASVFNVDDAGEVSLAGDITHSSAIVTNSSSAGGFTYLHENFKYIYLESTYLIELQTGSKTVKLDNSGYFAPTSGTVALGTATYPWDDAAISGQLVVTADAITDVPVTINLSAGQTANAFEVKDSGASDLFTVDKDGNASTTSAGFVSTGQLRVSAGLSTTANGIHLGGNAYIWNDTSTIQFHDNGSRRFCILNDGPTVPLSESLLFSSDASPNFYTTQDVRLFRVSAGVLGFDDDASGECELQFGTMTTSATLDAATGNEVANTLNYTTNKLTSGDDTGLLISKTDTASPGTSLLLDCQTDATSVLSVRDDGHLATTKFKFTPSVYHSLESSPWSVLGFIVRDSLGNQKIGFGGSGFRMNKTASIYWTSDGALNYPDEFISRNASGGIDFGKDTSTVVATIAQDGYGIQVTASAITDIPFTATGAVGQTASLGVFNNGTNDVLTVSPTGLMTVGDGTDADVDLVQVNVTGDPKLFWDESTDRFQFTKGLHVGGGLYFETGEIQAIHQATEVTSLPTGTTQTITLDDNNHQTLDLTSTTGDTTVTLTVPSGSAAGTLIVEQHATTARDITWALSSGTLKWCGTEPTWSSDSTSDVRIVTWRWDGAIMYLAATDVAA